MQARKGNVNDGIRTRCNVRSIMHGMVVYILMGVTWTVVQATHPVTEGDHIAIICSNILKLDCTLFSEAVNCGTDGVTYNNTCEFAQGHCLSPTLHVQHSSACGHPNTEPGSDVGKPGLSAVLGLVCGDIVHVDCTRQPSELLCASDGHVYQNHCFFEKARCTSHATIDTLHVQHAEQC